MAIYDPLIKIRQIIIRTYIYDRYKQFFDSYSIAYTVHLSLVIRGRGLKMIINNASCTPKGRTTDICIYMCSHKR